MKALSANLDLARYQKKDDSREYKRFQTIVAKMIKDYGIKPPATFRLFRLGKNNIGLIEYHLASIEESLESWNKNHKVWEQRDRKFYAGILISKIFPKKEKVTKEKI